MNATPPPLSAAEETAFAALSRYGPGSGRATLLPLDEAVARASRDPIPSGALSARLAVLLGTGASAPAKRYACEKLAVIGDVATVPALRNLLSDANLADAARTALQAMPGAEPSRALRASLSQVAGLVRIGVVTSLGARRDQASVGPLARLLSDPDVQTAAAAAAALGEIGDPRAARALKVFSRRSSTPLRQAVADAVLACAQRLHREGHWKEASVLAAAIDHPGFPNHVRAGAAALR